MKAVLAGILFAFTLAAGPAAQAASDPDPWIEFSIYNNQVLLRSLDGTALPLDTSDGSMNIYLRTYDDDVHDTQEVHPAANDPVRLQMARGKAYGEVTMDGLFGDMRATVGYTGPTTDWSGSDFIIGGNAVLTLPARSMLTVVGWVQVRSGAPWERNYAAFERGLIAGTDGTFGERYILDGSDASSQYFITAVNPLDEAATFYFYSNLYGNASSYLVGAPPVPEPAGWVMLAVGMGLLARVRRRPNEASSKPSNKVPRTFRIRSPGPFE